MATRTLADIPADEVDDIVDAFEDEGCTVTKEQQADGRFTVVADCPDPE